MTRYIWGAWFHMAAESEMASMVTSAARMSGASIRCSSWHAAQPWVGAAAARVHPLGGDLTEDRRHERVIALDHLVAQSHSRIRFSDSARGFRSEVAGAESPVPKVGLRKLRVHAMV
jgi:hypothetical protein